MSRLPPRLLAGILNMAMLVPSACGQARSRTEDIPERIIAVARSQLGVLETEGPNRGPMVDAFNLAAGGKLGDDWCAAFVSWVMGQVDKEHKHQLALHKLEGLPMPADFERVATQLGVLRDAKTYTLKAGDLLIFKWPNGDYHLEIVTGPENTQKNRIPTIGGNAETLSKQGNFEDGVRESYFRRRMDGTIGYDVSNVVGVVDIRALLEAKKDIQPHRGAAHTKR